MLPEQGAVGTNPESRHGFWGCHPWDVKPGVQDPKVPAGTRHPGGVWSGVWALRRPGSRPQQVPASFLAMSRRPSAPGMSPSLPGLWASPCPSSPGAQQAGGPPRLPTLPEQNSPPRFPGNQRAAPTLSRRLLLLNCANEMTLIKAIAPQLGDGCCRLSGAPQPQPCISTGQDEGPHCGDTVPEPSPGDMA